MFGQQSSSGSCVCGCASPVCVQAKNWSVAIASPPAVAAATDAENMRTWVNGTDPDCIPWLTGAAGWLAGGLYEFDDITDTIPDASFSLVNCPGGVIISGGEFNNASTYFVQAASCDGGVTEGVTRVAFLLPDSTAYVVGVWCNQEDMTGGANRPLYQQACKMTGTPVGTCYSYNVPVPYSGLVVPQCCPFEFTCDPSCNSATYLFLTITDYDGLFAGNTWSGFVSACAANPSTCFVDTSSVPDCLSPDPFFGSSPP